LLSIVNCEGLNFLTYLETISRIIDLRTDYIPLILHLTANMTSTPTGVNEFPFAIVDAYSVPSVVRLERWDRLTWFQRCVAKAFAISRTDHSLKTGLQRQSRKQSCVALAHC
jgi:hypothetical protein